MRMRIVRAKIENFRLLRDVEVGFEERTTLIVGRNNSGKTSIAELFRRLLSRSEEHTSELQSLMRNSYAVFCLKNKKTLTTYTIINCNTRKPTDLRIK